VNGRGAAAAPSYIKLSRDRHCPHFLIAWAFVANGPSQLETAGLLGLLQVSHCAGSGTALQKKYHKSPSSSAARVIVTAATAGLVREKLRIRSWLDSGINKSREYLFELAIC
jgi:hypothetical protein